MADEVVAVPVPAELISASFVDGCLVVKLDADRDGEPLLELKVFASEAIQEALGIFKK